ncbi:MAG TPA: hypothetical protein VH419_00195 [Nocardioidaceae bacterium]|jgi:hypothetical protein
MTIEAYDPFDLPDWLGTHHVSWQATSGLHDQPVVRGRLTSDEGDEIALDLLAVDAAYPRVACPEDLRKAAHQAWHFGQVELVVADGRVAAAVPGIGFDANLACDVLIRLAKSVGAPSDHYTVSLAL